MRILTHKGKEMKIDIEKLHEAIDNPYTEFISRSGKTTIMIHQIVGEIHLGYDKTIVVLAKTDRDISNIQVMMEDIFPEQDINVIGISKSNRSMVVSFEDEYTTILFRHCNDETEHRLKGLKAVVYKDQALDDHGYI